MEETAARYRPQIDGLRALAVLPVLFQHLWFKGTDIGHPGVRLFFVISGFLITERLLAARRRTSSGEMTVAGAVWQFFARRALRIFPAYYALLLVLMVLNTEGFRSEASWHFLYLSNLRFAALGDWLPWFVAHLWSLSVEEQFYLLWPWVILLVPAGWLAPTVLFAVNLAIMFRMGMLLSPWADNPPALWDQTPASLDALGLGAFLAVVGRESLVSRLLSAAAVPFLFLVVVLQVGPLYGFVPGNTVFVYVIRDAICALAFVAVVARADHDHADIFGRVLSFPPMRWIGQISYGIYLYHLPLLALSYPFIEYGAPGPRLFFIVTGLTLIVAAASRVWLEAPLLRLKDRF